MTARPHIAILGRPNVGKSTLFNRLVGRRQAIVDPMPGVTRDRIEGEYDWDNRRYVVSDLAGWDESPTNPFAQETSAQIAKIAARADIIILLVDGKDGPTAWDKALAEKLRKAPCPVLLAVNKCDTVQAFGRADQFWELGMGEPIPISATHNLNVDELLDRIAALAPGVPEDETLEEDEDEITVAIVGRQNVGKSTLFNALIGDHRAIVSDIPGTTRDAIDTAIEYEGRRMVFIDTAGMKRRTRVNEPVDYYSIQRAKQALERSQMALLMIDCSEGVTDTDRKIAAVVQEARRACVLTAAKWDLSEDAAGHRDEFVKHLRKSMHFVSHAPVVFTSGLNNEGIPEVFSAIIKVHAEFMKQITTSAWNKALNDALAFRPPPTMRGKLLKINYITQIRAGPPTLALFVNQPEFLRDNYKRYLENFFRDRFGFEGAPIVFQIRRKSPKSASPIR